ncbi:amidase [Streptomyces sp. XM4193]|uniref:peptidoglycan-binding protein n=1 Tax=Streptomyces sp. XM4193 TaxID=2929782 RepID=UPI001FFA5E14|nr:peptidoglycan-binding protein [Streptomyces sp. XM4193]MCK1794699.1 amidase [Streptomyces sp. XM4193]
MTNHRHRSSGPRARRTALAALAVVAAGSLVVTGQLAGAAPAPEKAGTASVADAFGEAAEEYQVPEDLLLAVGYGETRLKDHGGKASQAGGYGPMHLVSNPTHRTLDRAAELTGLAEAELRTDPAANIRGSAAVLSSAADRLGVPDADRDDVNAWYPVVAEYSGASEDGGAKLYADHVYELLEYGLAAEVGKGEHVSVAPRETAPERGRYASVDSLDVAPSSDDYGPAKWAPAHSSNFTAGRTQSIDTVVVHVTQGSYAGSISWYQNPESNVSAHYTIRSSDGEVTQSVRDADTAWHARNANSHSVGIEHEGYVDDAAWFTDSMYRSSAALTKHLAAKHNIPKDRQHIVGHVEVPGNDHTDPGPHWDWDYYMELIDGDPGDPGDPDDPVELDFGSYETLKDGSSGAQVKAVQHLLNTNGHDAGAVDGAFGPTTTAAVKAFQTAKGLSADGTVGKQTWTALLSAGDKPTLKQGSSGAAVSRVQRALTAALGKTVGIDGSFGPATDQAVRDYQTARGLGVDGAVGNETWTALQSGK